MLIQIVERITIFADCYLACSISIEDVKIAYDLLLKNGSVERATINQFANRCSSAILLVFSQVPFIGVVD